MHRSGWIVRLSLALVLAPPAPLRAQGDRVPDAQAGPDTLGRLRRRFDLIVMDLPSVLVSTDVQVLAGFADRLVLVVRAGVTPAKVVRQALGELDRGKLLGVALNDSRRELPAWLDQRL